MMEGNRTENLCNRSFGWLQREENDAKPWLWKLSNCFSAAEKSLPCSAKTVICCFTESMVFVHANCAECCNDVHCYCWVKGQVEREE